MRNRFRVFLFFCIAVLIVIPVFAQDETGISTEEGLSAAQNVTLDFKDADIQNVLKIISYKSGVNIVTTPDVVGSVTIRLVDVPWDRALDVILKTYGYGYERQANIILVTKMENISKIQSEEPLTTEIFHLKFLDAQDAQKILIPLMSPRGKISVLYARGQKGWQFGTFKIGAEDAGGEGLVREAADKGATETISIEKTAAGDFVSRKADFNPSVKSRILVITDTVASLERIRTEILPRIDKKPKQVLIETRLMEVNEDDLRDLGVDWGYGSYNQAESSTLALDSTSNGRLGIGAQSLSSLVAPSVFGPESTGINSTPPFDAGLEFAFRKISGTQFEMIIHALEEDTDTNTLSAPRILTLDNQEASILVGYHTPILKSIVTAGDSSGTGATVTQDLDYYQEIGIRLNVVPQINDDGYINMIVHPSVTSSTSNVTATSTAGSETTSTSYPIIDVREAQTQVLIKDGETIVIGGLLKDVQSKQTIGIPLLMHLPWVGGWFRRDTYDNEKVDLLIFITARIVEEGEFSPDEIAKLQQRMEKAPEEVVN